MCVHICICVYVYTYTLCVYVYIYILTNTCTYYIGTYMCMYACINMYKLDKLCHVAKITLAMMDW